jgi:lysine 2,3-aminomutase
MQQSLELPSIITTYSELQSYLNLSEEERTFNNEDKTSLPLRIPSYFLQLIDPSNPQDPLRRQVVPTCNEQQVFEQEQIDPLREVSHSVSDRLIHRYPSRAAFLTTDICPIHCRHCFRRRFTGTFQGPASELQTLDAANYVGAHPQIKEVLFTGGDVLTLSDDHLASMIKTFRDIRKDLIIRICTRMPASYPMRITKDLITMLTQFDTAPFYLMTQFNHSRELTKKAIAAVRLFIDAGIPAMNQTVLLRGVNDTPDTLQELCETLLFNRIKPYYLFQGDLVVGTNHFRVSIQKGLALEAELRRRVSGLAMPTYAIDLPDGGGKIPLTQGYLSEQSGCGVWHFKTVEGEKRSYPDPLVTE